MRMYSCRSNEKPLNILFTFALFFPEMMKCHRALCFQFSCKKCCFFLLIIIIIFILISASLSVIIIFILKPRKPIFSFQALNIASYKFDVSDSSTVFLSLVASVTLNSHNPNRVGIRYDFSRLEILNNGVAVGMMRIPEFYQPARSHNVSIQIDIFFQCLDISTIMSGAKTRNFPIKVLGDIGVHIWVLKIELPKIKVNLDCDVAVDWRYVISVDESLSLKALKNRIARFDANLQAVSKKCSVGFYL